jgi:hypothetical protein
MSTSTTEYIAGVPVNQSPSLREDSSWIREQDMSGQQQELGQKQKTEMENDKIKVRSGECIEGHGMYPAPCSAGKVLITRV